MKVAKETSHKQQKLYNIFRGRQRNLPYDER